METAKTCTSQNPPMASNQLSNQLTGLCSVNFHYIPPHRDTEDKSTTSQFLPLLTLTTDYQYPLQFSSVAQSCPTLCDPTNRSTPGLPVHHQLPEFTQTHIHQVSDAIQPSHPLSSPSPPAPNPSQHQSLFQ